MKSLPTGFGYFASLEPQISNRELNVNDVFIGHLRHIRGQKKYFYYIKKKYYTKENLEQGESLFVANCSICHGKEADGSGLRAASMQDAKPRMLTNLDWIANRDDLRLLRSIKYGVPGTAMTPWGDYTSTLQRLQLVMYIRSLSKERKNQEELSSALYNVFDKSINRIEIARKKNYGEMEITQKNYSAARSQRDEGVLNDQLSQAKTQEELVKNYQKELNLLSQYQEFQQKDMLYVNLMKNVKNQKEIYTKSMGSHLMGSFGNGPLFSDFLTLIEMNGQFTLNHEDHLVFNYPNEEKIGDLVANSLRLSIKEMLL